MTNFRSKTEAAVFFSLRGQANTTFEGQVAVGGQSVDAARLLVQGGGIGTGNVSVGVVVPIEEVLLSGGLCTRWAVTQRLAQFADPRVDRFTVDTERVLNQPLPLAT